MFLVSNAIQFGKHVDDASQNRLRKRAASSYLHATGIHPVMQVVLTGTGTHPLTQVVPPFAGDRFGHEKRQVACVTRLFR